MNIPINFDKIDETKFSIDGIDFRIEVDNNELGDMWVYECTSRRYPLCFDIDWKKETYALIKCAPGDGRNGTVLATDSPLMIHLMRDADSFIQSFLKDTIRTLITNNLL
jgi:hypothetical protein